MSRQALLQRVETAAPLKAKLDLPSMETPEAREIAALVRAALDKAAIQQKDAAFTMGVDPSQFRRQLDGLEGLPLQRLLKLPDAFWRELLVLLAVRYHFVVKRTLTLEETA